MARKGSGRGNRQRRELERALGALDAASQIGAPASSEVPLMPHPAAGTGEARGEANQPTSGVNTSTGRGRGGGVPGGVAGGEGGTLVSSTNRAVGHGGGGAATGGGVAVSRGRGSDLGDSDHRGPGVSDAGSETENLAQPGVGGDAVADEAESRRRAAADREGGGDA